MKKTTLKIIGILLCMMLGLLVISTKVNAVETAEEKVSENGLKYYVEENKAVITGTTNANIKTLEIPNYIGDYHVEEIAESAFAGNKTLEKVTFENGIGEIEGNDTNETLSIRNEAFKGCTNLKEVVFPEKGDIWLDDGNIFEGTAIETIKFRMSVGGMYCTALQGMTKLKNIYFEVKDYETTWIAEDYYQLNETTINYLAKNVTVYSYTIDDYTDNVHNGSGLSPKGFADKHGIKFVDLATLKNNTLTDNSTNVTVTVNSDADAKIKVDAIEKNSEFYQELEKDFQNKNYDIVLAYDISVEGDYEGNIKVSLPVDSKYNGKVATIIHYKADGTMERFTCVVVNEKVTVDVTELSPFVVAFEENKTDATNPTDTDKTDTTPATNTEDSSNDLTEQENSSESKLDETPKTGDNNTIIITSILATLMLGIIIKVKNEQ